VGREAEIHALSAVLSAPLDGAAGRCHRTLARAARHARAPLGGVHLSEVLSVVPVAPRAHAPMRVPYGTVKVLPWMCHVFSEFACATLFHGRFGRSSRAVCSV
jgi:hypothetical protein